MLCLLFLPPSLESGEGICGLGRLKCVRDQGLQRLCGLGAAHTLGQNSKSQTQCRPVGDRALQAQGSSCRGKGMLTMSHYGQDSPSTSESEVIVFAKPRDHCAGKW